MAATVTYPQIAIYVLHCLLFPVFAVLSYYNILMSFTPDAEAKEVEHTFGFTLFFTGVRMTPMIGLPRIIMTIVGLLCCVKCYVKRVSLNSPPLLSPFICFRVVTRGDYPDLVKQNVKRNIETCLNVGLQNFLVEVVTDKAVGLTASLRVREIVVPANYVTKSGVMYKGRALQYCLEDGVDQLDFNDWIVHLDEETLLTEDSVRGIINFVMDGRYPFGQGLITYNNNPVNEFLTLMDAGRVSDDVGAIGGSFKFFHKPLFGWKGSYCVCQAGAEKHVSFDYGLAASVAEDYVFCLIAFKYGYTFNFIEGEMLEQSPFTILDFIKQRKRWFEGKWLTLWLEEIPLWCKTFIMSDMVAWASTPILVMNPLLEIMYTLPRWFWHDALNSFLLASALYAFFYGVVKSYTLAPRKKLGKLILQLLTGSLLILPFYTICYMIVIIWYIVGKKRTFHVVQKWDSKLTKTSIV